MQDVSSLMDFVKYNQDPIKKITTTNGVSISSFIKSDSNIDKGTIESFGDEWLKFNEFTEDEISIAGNQYFDIVNESLLNKNSVVLDLGCGSGRWTKFIANKVKLVESVDPSTAVFSAVKLNFYEPNVRVTQASVSNLPFSNGSFNFIICLGVLHHIPDTQLALIDAVKKLKTGGSILLYLYYSIDDRGFLYQLMFKFSTVFRIVISKMPKAIKKFTCDIISIFIYYPLIFIPKLFYLIFGKKYWINKMPLSYYADKSFHIIRNDALDRFGTPLEQRFSKPEITKMMKNAGLSNINFSENQPFWHMIGTKL